MSFLWEWALPLRYHFIPLNTKQERQRAEVSTLQIAFIIHNKHHINTLSFIYNYRQKCVFRINACNFKYSITFSPPAISLQQCYLSLSISLSPTALSSIRFQNILQKLNEYMFTNPKHGHFYFDIETSKLYIKSISELLQHCWKITTIANIIYYSIPA